MFLLTTILALSLVSAADFTLSKTSIEFTETSNSQSFTMTPVDGLVAFNDYTLTLTQILDDDDNPITITTTPDSITALDDTTAINVATTVDFDDLTVGKSYTGDLIITNDADANDTETITVNFLKTFCEEGEQSTNDHELEITEVDIENDDGDDDEWSPLDEITIEVEVTNNGDEKVKDVIVELGIFNSDGENIVRDLENLDDEQIDLGNIDDDEDDTTTFEFKVPADFEDENYKIVIKAYSDKEDEENVCTSSAADFEDEYFELITGEREDDEDKHVIVDDIVFSPETAEPGDIIQVTAEVFNIGDEEYEDQVMVSVYNQELGINEEIIVTGDLDAGDSEVIDFEFEVPSTANPKLYTLEFKTYYDYDEDDDEYDLESDERVTKVLKVEGTPLPPTPELRITAGLDSDSVKAGEEVTITATLENTGDDETTYSITLSGNSAWSSASISPRILTLTAGESKDVEIILTLDDDVEAETKDFTLKATSNAETIEKDMSLTIEEDDSRDANQVVDHLKTNWFIYVIVLVNLILIIAIISVIKRMIAPRPVL